MSFWTFLGDYVKGKLLDAVLSGAMAVTEATSKRVEARQRELLADGHSKVCAGAWAADENGLLDGDLRNVVRLGGGCAKCGIK